MPEATEPDPTAGETNATSLKSEPDAGTTMRRQAAWRWLVRLASVLVGLAILWGLAMTLLIIAYRFVDPPRSALMMIQSFSGQAIDQRWQPIDAISPLLARSVIASEDARFCEHFGIDLRAIEKAVESAQDGAPRGGSTLTMQLAKNLFLWPDRSYIRKALEVPLTILMETFWSKRRIIEIYLNVVEWGPGIFGAEAAARNDFGKSAKSLTRREAALLAVSLPRPKGRKAGKPGRLMEKLAARIVDRVKAMPKAGYSCIHKDAQDDRAS